ncbi:hydantoinase B/oxoprolinase family protein [Brucella intermedia]|uniref:hydantoinase B/oxoprolinase family protein n=1 Tax=Brucella intermedia TaxID=94625 RepID=UPI00224ADC61|nr:hydantoinase B/oxoprolinase family protein [Brucella intermedia]
MNTKSSEGTMTDLDAVTLEVLWTRIISIVDEAAKVIVRTSFSTFSNEANDFAVVMTDAEGRSLAQNTQGIPSFIGTLPATVRHMLDEFGAEAMMPGDVYITNDPWQGTGHLPDVCMVKPIFAKGKLVAFAASTSHVPDIGGIVRSMSPRSIFEEGFHIPLLRFMTSEGVDQTLLKLLRTNVRTPDQTVGDIYAQLAALDLVDTRAVKMLEEHDLADFEDLGRELFARSEAAMRNAIRALPEGTYHAEMITDGLDEPFIFKVALTIKDGAVVADYTGTTGQQPRAINCPSIYTYAMTAYAMRCALLPTLPNNDGMFRPISIKAEEGSLLNPRFPAAVGGRGATGMYVPPLVLRALYQVLPGRVKAAPGSPQWNLTLTGNRKGSSFAAGLFFNGGLGARPTRDGIACMSWPSNISSTPVEIAERDFPLRFEHKQLASGSGGQGQFRGGEGQDVLIRLTEEADNMSAVFIAERLRHPAPGLAGGGEGGKGAVKINEADVDARAPHHLKAGDTIRLVTPGGGGFGKP